MKKLEDLFQHQVQDLYSAESQLIKALPKMSKAAHNEKLKKAFEKHLEETKGHRDRLEEISKELGFKLNGEECKAMKGLIREAEDFLKEDAEDDVRDAGIIADSQRIEHYEISGYGTLVRYAKDLGHKAVANKLQKTLDEEYKADEDLNKLAESKVNKEAKS